MPGPVRKDRKHGRTPTTGANDWIEVTDVPFEDAPSLPKPGAGKRWHPWTLDWYAEASAMPHCTLWGKADWRLLFDLARMKDAWYKQGEDGKASEAAQIRLRERDLGIGPGALAALKIKYVPLVVEDDSPDLRHESQVAVEQDQAASNPQTAGKVTSLAERRAAITKSA